MLASRPKDGGNRIPWNTSTYKIRCGLIAWEEVISRLLLVSLEPEIFGDAAGFRGKQVKFNSSQHGTHEDHLLAKSLMHVAWKEMWVIPSQRWPGCPPPFDASFVHQPGPWLSKWVWLIASAPISPLHQLTQLSGPQDSSSFLGL